MYIKDFDSWTIVKKHINKEHSQINIRTGEIRWVSFGVNVGSEIDGKGVSYTRPGLIVSVVGSHLALVIPLTSKSKDVSGFLSMDFKGKQVSACIQQIRVISQRRIFSRIGRISDPKLERFKGAIKIFYDL